MQPGFSIRVDFHGHVDGSTSRSEPRGPAALEPQPISFRAPRGRVSQRKGGEQPQASIGHLGRSVEKYAGGVTLQVDVESRDDSARRVAHIAVQQ